MFEPTPQTICMVGLNPTLVRQTVTPSHVRTNPKCAVADPKCARGGGVSHILAEKMGVSFTLFKKMHENAIFSPIRGGGRTPGTPYAGSATECGVCSTLTNLTLTCFSISEHEISGGSSIGINRPTPPPPIFTHSLE